MAINCPTLLRTLVVADDARLAAQALCLLARPGAYVPVIDGPRLERPDREAEVIRRHNAAERARARTIVLAGLVEEAVDKLTQALSSKRTVQCFSTAEELKRLPRDGAPFKAQPLVWGRERIGVGLLTALRTGCMIEFGDKPSPLSSVSSKSGHLVVCEDGDDFAQVIAANYAFSLGAGLHIMPEVPESVAEQIMEDFYSLYDQNVSATDRLGELKDRLRALCGDVPIPDHGSITFIIGHLPFGFAFPEVPSTHLFAYPDLGISIINGMAAEQPESPGIGMAVLVDPQTTDAPEIAAARKLLPARRISLRGYQGRGATVRSIAQMIEYFPYDLLMLATHCGDASGYRWTYQFADSEKIERTLVVDIAIGVAATKQPDMLDVTQFLHFVSLDGVDWHDPKKSEKVHIGSAIRDFTEKTTPPADMQPVRKDTVERVLWSAALKMSDGNYIMLPRAVASGGTPIVINNACASWHRLAKNFMFCNARAYIGTLFMVTTTEAHEVTVKLLDKHFGKPLPTALWAAQREVYGDNLRRPYVITGIYPQRLRHSRRDQVRMIVERLSAALAEWRDYLRQVNPNDSRRHAAVREIVEFHEEELASLAARVAADREPNGR